MHIDFAQIVTTIGIAIFVETRAWSVAIYTSRYIYRAHIGKFDRTMHAVNMRIATFGHELVLAIDHIHKMV